MRRLRHVLALLVLASPALAQPAPEQPQGGPPMENGGPPAGMRRAPMRDRFEAANTTHDGKLTMQQAQDAHMMGVINNFAEIDTDHKGYVTLQDIHVWMRARRSARGGQMAPPLGQMAPPPGQMGPQDEGAPPPGGPPPQ